MPEAPKEFPEVTGEFCNGLAGPFTVCFACKVEMTGSFPHLLRGLVPSTQCFYVGVPRAQLPFACNLIFTLNC